MEVMLGMNTTQWWVYDNDNDVFIDPPKDVLDSLTGTVEEQEEQLQTIVDTNPDWLQDKAYWYDDIEI